MAGDSNVKSGWPKSLSDYVGWEFVGESDGVYTARMEVRPEHVAPNGFLQASVVVALADMICAGGTMETIPDGALAGREGGRDGRRAPEPRGHLPPPLSEPFEQHIAPEREAHDNERPLEPFRQRGGGEVQVARLARVVEPRKAVRLAPAGAEVHRGRPPATRRGAPRQSAHIVGAG